MKNFLNDMTQEEILAYIYTQYPNMAKQSVVKSRIRNPVWTAIKLYKKGKISLSIASKIANMSIEDFIQKLKAQGINIYQE